MVRGNGIIARDNHTPTPARLPAAAGSFLRTVLLLLPEFPARALGNLASRDVVQWMGSGLKDEEVKFLHHENF